MSAYLIVALVLNIAIIFSEIWAFAGLKHKSHILKYYTFYQNAIALLVSVIFAICSVLYLFEAAEIPAFVRGLRYLATTGLLFTMVIYFTLLAPTKNQKNLLSKDDFSDGFSPKAANFILHIFCPLASLISFTCFEREVVLENPIWTALVAVPSALYWLAYLLLTATHRWDEPYEFAPSKNRWIGILLYALIPISFIAISFILWNIK